jgi:hypothetical protein
VTGTAVEASEAGSENVTGANAVDTDVVDVCAGAVDCAAVADAGMGSAGAGVVGVAGDFVPNHLLNQPMRVLPKRAPQ